MITPSLPASPSSDDLPAASRAPRVLVAAPGTVGREPTFADVAQTAADVCADVAAATERLEELERLQALVVSTTAHELRTPLTVLRVHSDLLIESAGGLGDDERESLEAISRAVARLQEVSEHLVAELRDTAGGAEQALRRWLQVEDGSTPTRPTRS